MKFGGEVVEIVEAFDLTGSYRDAAELVGCSPTTVARYVALREAGRPRSRALRQAGLMDGYLEKVEEWVNASRGKVRADVVFSKLQAMGYLGSERTVRRAVRAAKEAYGQGHRRVYRPWIVEPGLWFLCGIPHKNHYAAAGIMRRHTTSGVAAEIRADSEALIGAA